MTMKMFNIRTFALLIILECVVYGSTDDMACSKTPSTPTRAGNVVLDARLKLLESKILELNEASLRVNEKVTEVGSASFYIQKDLHEKRKSHEDCRIQLDRQRKSLQEQLDAVSKEAEAIEGQNSQAKDPRKIQENNTKIKENNREIEKIKGEIEAREKEVRGLNSIISNTSSEDLTSAI
ncbi:MAG: hypothetical protein Q8K36_03690, partial [Alphaproteobacteria bacterium]|nr:hypothetical protein [Alphaproteobacteria bacterium]